MLEMLKEAGVTLLFDHRLREKTGVIKEGGRVKEIVMENGARFAAGSSPIAAMKAT